MKDCGGVREAEIVCIAFSNEIHCTLNECPVKCLLRLCHNPTRECRPEVIVEGETRCGVGVKSGGQVLANGRKPYGGRGCPSRPTRDGCRAARKKPIFSLTQEKKSLVDSRPARARHLKVICTPTPA
jgi:hypothetical protein